MPTNETRQANRAARKAEKRANKANATNPDKKKYGPFNIPDSTLRPGGYTQNAEWFLDDDRLDPANDPTLQPVVDAMQRESEEDYWRSVKQMRDSSARNNLLGSDYWQTAQINASEEFSEAQSQALANLYNNVRENALNRRLGVLDQINTRDIAEGNNKTAIRVANINIRPGMAQASVARGQLGLEREKWDFNKPWLNMGNLIETMRGLGDMSGYYEYPNYIPQEQGYTGPPSWVTGLMGGMGGAMNYYGAYKQDGVGSMG